MQLHELLFDAMRFDERRLLLDLLDLRDVQALSCTQKSFCVKLSPMDLDLLAVDENAYTWAGRPMALPAPWHNGISLGMGMPTGTLLKWTCRITEHRASKLPNQWAAFGLEYVDDSGWHMHLVSDRGCAYVDGRLRQQHELPELKAGDELRFTLDLSGKGSLSVRINRGPPQVLSGSRGLVPGRGLAKDRVREVYARAHIWDGAMVKARSRMPRTERRALGPHCAVTFLPSQAE